MGASVGRGGSRRGFREIRTLVRRKSERKHSKVAEPNAQRALDLVLKMMAIPGPSGSESLVVDEIISRLLDAGAARSMISSDRAHRRTLNRGDVGNLCLKLPGTLRAPRRMLVAHIDTVPLCVGSRPVVRNGHVRSADGATALGADDRAGASVLLTAAREILRRRLPHPPVTFLWPVQEEVGVQGVQNARLGALGRIRLAFNFDGGAPEKLTIGATGAYRIRIEILGRASHAGGAPEKGVSATAIAGLAIADLVRGGWHGDVQKGGLRGTSNIGFVEGGGPTNVVTPKVDVRAEARSHDPAFRLRIAEAIEGAFQRAAEEVRSEDGETGAVRIERRLDYESYQLPNDEPCISVAESAVRSVGLEPVRAIANGGLDANWLTARGIPTVSLGCGQMNPHTVAERLNVAQYQAACRIALRLATGTESMGVA